MCVLTTPCSFLLLYVFTLTLPPHTPPPHTPLPTLPHTSLPTLPLPAQLVIAQTRATAATTLTEVLWCGKKVPVKSERLRISLVHLQELRDEVERKGDEDDSTEQLCEQVLLECHDTLQVIKDELTQEKVEVIHTCLARPFGHTCVCLKLKCAHVTCWVVPAYVLLCVCCGSLCGTVPCTVWSVVCCALCCVVCCVCVSVHCGVLCECVCSVVFHEKP